MSDPRPDWAGLLQKSLDEWSKGRPDLGGRGLQQVIAQLQGPDHALWRALVHNQLALLSNQLGHWQYAKEQWELANQCWRDTNLTAGSVDLQETLDWYLQLLRHYGFGDRASRLSQLHQQGLIPLLDPWNEPQIKTQVMETAAVPAAPIVRARAAEEPEYAPLGGQKVTSSRPPPVVTPVQEWDQHVRDALKSAMEGKLQPALAGLDKAKETGVSTRERDNGHLLSLIYSAEGLVCFLAGDYSGAAQAKQEASRLWSSLGDSLKYFSGDTHGRFLRALVESGQSQAASVFGQRHRQKECPLLDPWSDLEVAMKMGDWQNNDFDVATGWKEKMESALQLHGRGNYVEAQKELGLLEQQMQPADIQRVCGALLFQMQSVMAYAMGDYDSAQILYRKALGGWDRLEPGQRRDGPFLDQLKNLVTLYGLEMMADRLNEGLCDPFVFYKHEHQMQKMEVTAENPEDQGNPRESWEKQLREAWEMAAKGRWDMARRRAAQAERVAKLINKDDLRVAYSLNCQGLFAQAAGDYTDAEQLYEEAVRGWRRGSHLPAARTAYSELCSILRDAEWESLAVILENMWDQPVARSALNPALLPLESLTKTGMKILAGPVEEEPDDGVLRLPSLPRIEKPPVKRMNWLLAGVLMLLIVGTAGAGWLWTKNHAVQPAGPKNVKATP